MHGSFINSNIIPPIKKLSNMVDEQVLLCIIDEDQCHIYIGQTDLMHALCACACVVVCFAIFVLLKSDVITSGQIYLIRRDKK